MADKIFDFTVTKVDRSKCSRVVPMKILVLGMPRTGTLSIRAALKRLGYNEVYHGFELFWGNRDDIYTWRAALEAKFEGKGNPFAREDWDKLLGHCQAITDAPGYVFAEELMEAYPNAKVILNLRDVDKWHESMRKTMDPDGRKVIPWRRAREMYCNIIPGFSSRRAAFYKVAHYTYGDNFNERGKQRFHNHNEWIRSLVPKDKLLEYEVSSGWGPLCEFLGEDVPDEPFPRGNEAEILHKRFNQLEYFCWTVAGLLWLGLAGCCVGGWMVANRLPRIIGLLYRH